MFYRGIELWIILFCYGFDLYDLKYLKFLYSKFFCDFEFDFYVIFYLFLENGLFFIIGIYVVNG